MPNADEPKTSVIFLVVAVALIDREGRVLVQRRPAGSSMAGLWEFPGGKVEPGETPEAALVRELAEELGVTVKPEDLQAAAFASEPLAGRHLLLLLYICRTWEGTPHALHADELLWCKPGALYDLQMPPADLPLIGLLKALI